MIASPCSKNTECPAPGMYGLEAGAYIPVASSQQHRLFPACLLWSPDEGPRLPSDRRGPAEGWRAAVASLVSPYPWPSHPEVLGSQGKRNRLLVRLERMDRGGQCRKKVPPTVQGSTPHILLKRRAHWTWNGRVLQLEADNSLNVLRCWEHTRPRDLSESVR